MCHIIVVDDEKIIRNGISKYIKKMRPELKFDGEFEDGKYAIEFLSENDVDIVVTDVRMTEKSGIDVAKFIFENKKNTKVIFLSAYQEFEYAKQAMCYNVQYYLSKPVKQQELISAVDELVAQIKNEKATREKIKDDERRLQSLIFDFKKEFYSDVLFIKGNIDEFKRRAATLGKDEQFFYGVPFIVASIRVVEKENWSYSKDEIYNCMMNVLRNEEIIQEIIPIIRENLEIIFVGEINSDKDFPFLKSEIESRMKELIETTTDLINIPMEFKIFSCSKNICSFLTNRNYNYNDAFIVALLGEKQKDFTSKIISLDVSGCKRCVEIFGEYVSTMSDAGATATLKWIFNNTFGQVFEYLGLTNKDEKIGSSENINDRKSMLEWSSNSLETVLQYVKNKSDSVEEITINKAKKYISEHFYEDIGLENVANYVHLSPIYFSRFFKQQTNMNMTEYLTNIRMDNAIKLFRTHKYKVYEISKMCGYNSSKYFAKTFKQHTGYTPSEYSRIY